ncbi:hypothetical protein NCH89_003582 [Salmonella enterica]|nr:hypothetical protein [Salmonella enterica]
MATLRSNTLVKIIIPVVALGAVAIGIPVCQSPNPGAVSSCSTTASGL